MPPGKGYPSPLQNAVNAPVLGNQQRLQLIQQQTQGLQQPLVSPSDLLFLFGGAGAKLAGRRGMSFLGNMFRKLGINMEVFIERPVLREIDELMRKQFHQPVAQKFFDKAGKYITLPPGGFKL